MSVGKIDQSQIVSEENIRVHCSNSTDFVVGKQTNFNGPVTIINCPVPQTQDCENVVIRDQIWTDGTSKAVEARAGEHALTGKGNENSTNHSTKQSHFANKSGTYSSLPVIKDLIAIEFLHIPLVYWLVITMVITAIVIATIVPLTAKVESESAATVTDERQFIGNESHLFFSKQQWKGLNASSKLSIIEPVPYVLISHTASEFCYETVTCQKVIQQVQKYQMAEINLADIGYNFMIGGDGYIYEGRGWGVRNMHTGFVGNRNIDINFVGDFSVYDVPTATQVDAVIQLLERGVKDCHIAQDYILLAHNQTTPTLSPGKNVYSIISQWEHFRIDPPKNLTLKKHHAGLDTNCSGPKPSPYVVMHLDKH